jgi:uncharacterized protein YjbI with pentapeptide repeats
LSRVHAPEDIHSQWADASFLDILLQNAVLINADFTEANLAEADFTNANLEGAHPEAARSLQGARFVGVKGLTEEQLKLCADKGAILP